LESEKKFALSFIRVALGWEEFLWGAEVPVVAVHDKVG